MLTLAEIVRITHIDRSALNRYLALPEVRAALCGADSHPFYPDSALPLFQRMADLHARKEVTPKTLAATLRREGSLAENPPDQNSDTLSGQEVRIPDNTLARSQERLARTPESEQALTLLPDQALALLERFADLTAQRLAHSLTPAQEDRLIRAQEAADLLACSPRSVGRFVKSVRPGVWKRSDLLKYIAEA